jgi:hypothetical protein
MKLLSYRIAWAVGIGVGACAIGAVVAACGSSSSGSSADGGPGTPGGPNNSCTHPNALTIEFNPMYSASIPGSTAHNFQVPAIVTGVSGATVTWTTSDSTAATTQPDPATGGTTITVLKPGMVTVFANINGDLCGEAPLNVTSATEMDWQLGNARYNSGNTLINPFAMMGMGDGGPPMRPRGGFMTPAPGTPSIFEGPDGGAAPACTNCHGPTATGGVFQGIEHTPEQTGGFSDEDLTNIIVNGLIPDGGYYDSTIIPYMFWTFFHRWTDMSPEVQKGIIVYLRALPPSPQSGKFDFNGLRRDGGMGGGPPPPMGDDSGSGEDSSTTTPDATTTTVVDAGPGADATPE